MEARDLAKTDIIGKSDPYAVLSHGNQKFRTNTAKNTQNPKWNYDADFNVPDQADDRIRVDIYDSDKIGKDKPLGSAFFDINEVMAHGMLPPGWYPLKGAKSGEVLMSADFEALDNNSSRLGTPDRESITGPGNNNLNRLGSKDQLLGDFKGSGEGERPGPLDGILHVDLLGARNLIKSDLIGKSDPYARLQLGDETYKTEVVKNTQNPEWNFGTDFTVDGKTIDDEVKITVFDHDKLGKGKSLGSLGLPVGQLLAEGQDPNFNRWFPLAGVKSGEVLVASHFLPFDPEAYRRMSGHGMGSRLQPGGVGAAAAKRRDSQEPKLSTTKDGSGGASSLKKQRSTGQLLGTGRRGDQDGGDLEGSVHLMLSQARNLPKADLIGKSDPYAIIACGMDTSNTPTVKDSQNPVWNHEVVFPVDPNTASALDIKILDADKLGKDKPLGQLRLDIADLAENGPIVNQWLPLEGGKSGEVQVTAEFIPQGQDDLDGNQLTDRQRQLAGILKPRSRGGEDGSKLLGRDGRTRSDTGKIDENDELIPGTLHLGKQLYLLPSRHNF